jgi:hypothetical protein
MEILRKFEEILKILKKIEKLGLRKGYWFIKL